MCNHILISSITGTHALPFSFKLRRFYKPFRKGLQTLWNRHRKLCFCCGSTKSGNPSYLLCSTSLEQMCPQLPRTSHCGTGLGCRVPNPGDHGWICGATAGLQLRADPALGIWSHQPHVSAPRGLPALHPGDLCTAAHLGQAQIVQNSTCLFILIFQGFDSSHDEGEGGSRPESTFASSFCSKSNIPLPAKLDCSFYFRYLLFLQA